MQNPALFSYGSSWRKTDKEQTGRNFCHLTLLSESTDPLSGCRGHQWEETNCFLPFLYPPTLGVCEATGSLSSGSPSKPSWHVLRPRQEEVNAFPPFQPLPKKTHFHLRLGSSYPGKRLCCEFALSANISNTSRELVFFFFFCLVFKVPRRAGIWCVRISPKSSVRRRTFG